jgi:DNA-binding transcriptional LysR family regulator
MNDIQLDRFDLNLLVTFEVLMLEGSVARAAARLGRTPSAISHALARLREQVGDPLMVKTGGRMQPSPFAQSLLDEVRPILRRIERVITPAEVFEPATSQRVFRVAIPAIAGLMASVVERFHAEAPHARLEWIRPSSEAYPLVAEGVVDIAHLGGDARLPDGLETQQMKPFTWLTFVRKGHPALRRWGMEEWLKWPHVLVDIANNIRNPISEVLEGAGKQRTIGASIPDFSGVAPLVARTNMLATFPMLSMQHDMQVYDLRVLVPPLELRPFPVRFCWSSRLANIPAQRWIRKIILDDVHRARDSGHSNPMRERPVGSLNSA